ncbi:MAG: class I SAM-dependent methyltransferase [Thermoleophilia bacterium]
MHRPRARGGARHREESLGTHGGPHDAPSRPVLDRQARTYDARTAGIERRSLAHSRRWVCDRATGHTLEIAIGTAPTCRTMPRSLRLTGVDASAAMLERAAERARTLGRSVDLVRADAADLPSRTPRSTPWCTFGLCCVADEESVITEALRVLRPAGHLLLADHTGHACGRCGCCNARRSC